MDEKTLEKLRRMMAIMDGDTLTKQEFVEHFEQLVEAVKEIEKKLNQKTDKRVKRLDEGEEKVRKQALDTVEKAVNKLEKTIADSLNRSMQEQNRSLNFLRDKVRNLKDGRDADEERIIENVLERIVLPEVQDPILDPVEIRNKLETLEDDERLDVSAIKGLKDVFKDIKALKGRPINAGIVGRDIIKDIDLSGDLDGATKTFNIQAVYNIISVDLSSFPYGSLRKNVDFTWTPTSITFTDEIDAATQLASGQSCVLTVVQG